MRRLPLVLASASPRRRTLLEGLGVQISARPSGVAEDGEFDTAPAARAAQLAEAKGRHVERALRDEQTDALVLAADTAVVLDGRMLGKPRDDDDARSMLRSLSGREHEVLTAVFLLRTDDRRVARCSASTRVRFRPYDSRTIEWYVATGEPMDKAGAYGIQSLGALLTEGIEGSWTNVVGLPLERLPGLFERVGLDLTDFMVGSG